MSTRNSFGTAEKFTRPAGSRCNPDIRWWRRETGGKRHVGQSPISLAVSYALVQRQAIYVPPDRFK